MTLKWLLGRDEHPLKFLDSASRLDIQAMPIMDQSPPLPKELKDLEPLQAEFYIKMHPHLPSPYFLTKHPLSKLVSFSEEEFHKICRFLGLFDLYAELRNVVLTSLFHGLKNSLSAEELKFLEVVRHEPNPVKLPKMHIGAWDLSKESLDKALFDRGKTRLRGALSQGYDTLFSFLPPKFYPPKIKPAKEVAETLIKQLETVLNKAF